MIKIALKRIGLLFQYLSISLLAITLTRMLLYFFNQDFFKELGITGVFNILWQGLRFDLSALSAYQAPFVLLFFIPFPESMIKVKRLALVSLFTLSNFLLIVFNSIDSIYFRFTLKRSTADLFSFVTTGDDTLRLLPQFFKDYWFILLIIILLLWLSIHLFRKVKRASDEPPVSWKYAGLNFFSLVFIAGLTILAIRGGFQLKPIRTLQAAEAVGVNNAPLVLNTPFTIMKTLNKESLKERKYFDERTLKDLYDPVIDFPFPQGSLTTKNVVVIIMESFSKEYMGPPFGIENKTPFLDSLAQQGLFFNRAFANGKKSIEGIPAILAGIPSLMEDPYITSIYSNNYIKTVASILREEGYATAFFHGGTTGTMGFDAFAKLSGFESYYGMEDFEDSDSYDGNWGIYDEPFFQFFAHKVNEFSNPFFATFFSLSSHHPYKIPDQYQDIYSGAEHPLLNTVAYSDMALKEFFDTARNMPWYANTLFVITADHTGQSLNPSFATQLGSFAVPLLFYAPSDSTLKGITETVTQHINIPPSILGYLKYGTPFFSFGRNSLEDNGKTGDFAINYLNNVYQFIQDDYVIHFDGEKVIGFYNYKTDSLLKNPIKAGNNILNKKLREMEKHCKAVIQTYNNALINNQQTVDIARN